MKKQTVFKWVTEGEDTGGGETFTLMIDDRNEGAVNGGGGVWRYWLKPSGDGIHSRNAPPTDKPDGQCDTLAWAQAAVEQAYLKRKAGA